MRSARLVALVALAVSLVLPMVQAGSWLQPRGDAAATGFQPGQGPAWSDVALRIEVPGNATQPPDDPPPLILEDRVIFVALPIGDDYNGTMSAFSADRDTGELERITTVPFRQPMRMATDGTTLYLSGAGAVHARPLEPGGHNWDWTWASGATAGDESLNEAGLYTCASMALEPEHVTVLCRVNNVDTQGFPTDEGRHDSKRGDLLAARLDAETGQASWVWRPRDPTQNDTGLLQDEYKQPPLDEDPIGLAVVGNHVIVETQEGQQGCISDIDYCQGNFRVSVRALDTEDGEPVWDNLWRSPPVNRTVVAGEEITDANRHQSFPSWGNPAASEQAVYVKADELYKLNIGNGDPIWKTPIGDQDVDPSQGDFATAVSLGGPHVYTTTAQTVYRIDRQNPQDGWSASLNFSAEEGFQEDPVVTPERVYAAALSEDGDEDVYAFDAQTGDLVWQHEVEDELWAFSIGEGIGAYTARDTTDDTTSLVLLGRTEASPAVRPQPSTAYPDPGQTVEVDLSETTAGLQGPVTRYKAIWGDGTETPWQEDPVLTHTYGGGGDVEARFLVANKANQTVSTTQTFHVGQDAPREPNLVETAFARENQDMTFGILGILVAVTGGAIGVGRRYRKRSRLERELEALETGFEETKDRPGQCEAFLETRKGRARSLVLDGDLTEEQGSMIEARADELRRELRTRALSDEFGFLPYSLVTKAREMLEDGRVTSLEAEAFLAALEEVEDLTDDQRTRVRERIKSWFARDTGGGASP